MHPDLFTLGPFTLHSYGLFTALGFLVAVYLARRQAGSEGFSPDQFVDLAFWIIFSGLIGARLLYVLTTWSDYARRPADVFKVWDGGLVFYGGFILAAFTAVWYIRRLRLSLYTSPSPRDATLSRMPSSA